MTIREGRFTKQITDPDLNWRASLWLLFSVFDWKTTISLWSVKSTYQVWAKPDKMRMWGFHWASEWGKWQNSDVNAMFSVGFWVGSGAISMNIAFPLQIRRHRSSDGCNLRASHHGALRRRYLGHGTGSSFFILYDSGLIGYAIGLIGLIGFFILYDIGLYSWVQNSDQLVHTLSDGCATCLLENINAKAIYVVFTI